MAWAKAAKLTSEISDFIHRYSDTAAPESEFNALALKLFRFQHANNAWYAKFCGLTGAHVSSVKNWKQIPAVPASFFKEFQIRSFPRGQTRAYFQTSGTTASKSGKHYFSSLSLYEQAVSPMFRRYLLPDGANLDYGFLTASPKEMPHSSLSFMMGCVRKRFAGSRGKFYVRSGRLHPKELEKDLVSAKKPVCLLATAFSLVEFLDYLRCRGAHLKLPQGSRIMETGGFKGRARVLKKERLYQYCARFLGIPVNHCVSEYGMTELSSQYYDSTLKDALGGVHQKAVKQGPSWMRAVVVDPRRGKEAKRGRRGLLKHLDLANIGSVAAIQTEDIGMMESGGFELMGRRADAPLRGCSLDYETIRKERL